MITLAQRIEALRTQVIIRTVNEVVEVRRHRRYFSPAGAAPFWADSKR